MAWSGHITVRARREGRQLVIEVADTGVGMAAATNVRSGDGGFGIAQVRERIATLPGGTGRVDVVSTPGEGTTIRLHLPLNLPATTA
jgi:signal transduction histidine kinase